MPKLGDWVRAHLDGNMGDHGQPIGPEGLAALDHLLAHGFQLRLPLASSLESDDRHVMVATTEQCELLRSLEEHPRAAIAGVAGSGKTVLAVHKATELAEANASARVLLTCFNVPLGEHLKRLTAGHRNIVAGSFHQICAAVATEAGVEIPNTKDAKELFGEAYPTALVSAVCERPELAFDAVIVDEAQDFSDLWLASLEQTIASADSSFWVFYDDNQRLYERRGALEKRFPGPPFRLKRNVRNPKPVFERLFPLLGSTVATSAGPEGRPVEEIVVPDDRQMPAVLTRLVTQLVEKDQVEPAEIAVLGATSERLAELCPSSRFGRVQTCDAAQPVRGRVCLDTIRRFKGLERSVIILVDPADIAGADELQYVGLSRPTGHLILFGTRMPKMETYDE
jgi:DNA helicase IV